MYELVIINLVNKKKFTKIFNSEYLKNEFKNKCKYSKKIKVIGEFKK